MKILYIGYWGINEGLSQATILPNLKLLAELGHDVTYVSLERIVVEKFNLPRNKKFTHIGLPTTRFSSRIINKILDLWLLNKKLVKIAKKMQAEHIICRSSLAGFYGYRIFRKLNISFSVESFEPHADYMVESGVWKERSLEVKLVKRWETEQKKNAWRIITVSENYRNELIAQGTDSEKIMMAPCPVDTSYFARNKSVRKKMRSSLGVKDGETVGIYVGKFGGIYMDEEAFALFSYAKNYFRTFKLILLTQDNPDQVSLKLQKHGLSSADFFIKEVPHQSVPDYLSAADFAFSTIKPALSRQFCCPTKNGEYWAAGLSFITPDGVGDDSKIIKSNGGGTILNFANLDQVFDSISKQIEDQEVPRKLASKFRSIQITKQVYENLLSMQK